MENTLNLRRVGNLDVYFRNPRDCNKSTNQPLELEKMIKFLTGEDFEDCEGEFKRKLKNPELFQIINKYQHENLTDKHICLCTENTCSYLVIVEYIPTKTYFALGSVCYKRFDEENETEIYYHCKAKRCDGCKIPLVYKVSKFTKNTNKKCEGNCFGCVDKKKEEDRKKQEQARNNKEEANRVYLNVSYDVKDDAKSMGARWNPDKKKWYAPNNSAKYEALIKKYS